MTLDFDDTQIQLIVNVLAQRPYGEVFELMNHIQRQVAAAQQQKLQAVPAQRELAGT
jgi:hypothetical protein